MQFYFEHNYDFNLAATHLQIPDQLGFMQKLVLVDKSFKKKSNWKPYLIIDGGVWPSFIFKCLIKLYKKKTWYKKILVFIKIW